MVNVKGHLGYPVTSSQVSFPSSTGVADQFSAQETTFSMQLRFFILVGCAYVTWPLLKSWFCVKTCVPSSSPLRRTCLGPRKQLHWEAWRSQRLVVWWPWVWCLKRRSATWTSQVPAVCSHVCFIQFTNMLGHIAWDSSGVATDSMDFDVFGPRMWWSWRKYGIFRCLDQQIFVTAAPRNELLGSKISQGILAFMWHYPKAGFGGIWWIYSALDLSIFQQNLIDSCRSLQSLKSTSQFHQLRWKSAIWTLDTDGIRAVASLASRCKLFSLAWAMHHRRHLEAHHWASLSDVVHDEL